MISSFMMFIRMECKCILLILTVVIVPTMLFRSDFASVFLPLDAVLGARDRISLHSVTTLLPVAESLDKVKL